MESDNWYITDIHKANKRIKKLEAENERLKAERDEIATIASKFSQDDFNRGMERAAEISHNSRFPDGMDIADAIRAEIKDD